MIGDAKSPAHIDGAAGLGLSSSVDADDTRNLSKAPIDCNPQEVCLDLLREDLGANIALLQATLDVALATIDAGDDCGLLYSLRRSHAYWRAIAGSACELADLRKGGEQ